MSDFFSGILTLPPSFRLTFHVAGRTTRRLKRYGWRTVLPIRGATQTVHSGCSAALQGGTARIRQSWLGRLRGFGSAGLKPGATRIRRACVVMAAIAHEVTPRGR
jgi:hypothetical protein